MGKPVSPNKRIIHRKRFAALQLLSSHISLSVSKYCHVTALGSSSALNPQLALCCWGAHAARISFWAPDTSCWQWGIIYNLPGIGFLSFPVCSGWHWVFTYMFSVISVSQLRLCRSLGLHLGADGCGRWTGLCLMFRMGFSRTGTRIKGWTQMVNH